MHEHLPELKRFPVTLLSKALVRIELQEGIPIFKATRAVQKRIELLVAKQPEGLSTAEREELDGYLPLIPSKAGPVDGALYLIV